jgi:cold shock CspA family protein/ribosome-associated translation inhibitor RaiA
MTMPLEVTFRSEEASQASDELRDLIEQRLARVEQLQPRATRCRVVIDQPHEHASSGNPYEVVVTLSVATKNLVVREQPGKHPLHEPLVSIIRSAFDALEQQVKSMQGRQRHEVKHHDDELAVVRNLPDPEGAMGWIQSPTEGEIPFGPSAVAGDEMERLTVGSLVRYEVAADEQGLRATTVKLMDKPGVRHEHAGDAG